MLHSIIKRIMRQGCEVTDHAAEGSQFTRPEFRLRPKQRATQNAHGQPLETTVVQRSGSPELDESALRAASLLRFAPPPSKSQPVEIWAQVELRFNFSGFEFSRIGEPLAQVFSNSGDRGYRAKPVIGRERAVRRLIEQLLQSPQPDRTSGAPTANDLESLTTVARDWGPVTVSSIWVSFMASPARTTSGARGASAGAVTAAKRTHWPSLFLVAVCIYRTGLPRIQSRN